MTPVASEKLSHLTIGMLILLQNKSICFQFHHCSEFQILLFSLGFDLINVPSHRSQRGSYNCLHCSMKVVYYIFTSTPGVVRIHFWTNPRTQVFFEKISFFILWGPDLKMSQDGCISGHKVYPIERALEH